MRNYRVGAQGIPMRCVTAIHSKLKCTQLKGFGGWRSRYIHRWRHSNRNIPEHIHSFSIVFRWWATNGENQKKAGQIPWLCFDSVSASIPAHYLWSSRCSANTPARRSAAFNSTPERYYEGPSLLPCIRAAHWTSPYSRSLYSLSPPQRLRQSLKFSVRAPSFAAEKHCWRYR